MIDTPATAAQKWCPMVRQVWADFDAKGAFTTIGNTPAFNAVHENRGGRERRLPCVGPECMMWRSVTTLMPSVPDQISSRGLGYCGLAGPPLALADREAMMVALRAEVPSAAEERAA